MIEIVALAPENEMPAAQRLRELIMQEWPDLAESPAPDRVRIFAGAQMLVDVDLIVEVSLERERPVAACRMRDGAMAPASSMVGGLLTIEVKQQSRERFRIEGTEIYPLYGRVPSKRSVAKQVSDGAIAVADFLRRYSNEQVFAHGLGWLTDVPEADLLAAPPYIVGCEATWTQMLQVANTRSRSLFAAQTPAVRQAVVTLGNVLAQRRGIAPRDRAAVDRLTNATIADGKFEEVREALGRRQIRLAGRAGSGKSTTIALLADYVARVRQERLLVLTYHHALCREIDRLIRSIVDDDALVDRHVRVETLVDFLADACAQLGADIPRQDGRPDYPQLEAAFRDFVEAEPAQERRDEAEVLEVLEPDRFSFDYVCIDEAQDCLDCERDALRLFYPPCRFVLADGMEQLVRRQIPCDWTAGITSGDRLHVELPQSLRMARNIAEFATAAACQMGFEGWRITPHPELTGGRVIVQEGAYDAALLEMLLQSLDSAKLPRKDLLICVPPREVVPDGPRRDSRVAELLRSVGCDVWNGCDEIVRRTEFAGERQVRVVQYDSMRGLEGWATLLVGLDAFYTHRLAHPHLGPGDRLTPEQVAKRYLLMALTRAARTLAITVDDAASPVANWLRAASRALPDGVAEWETTASTNRPSDRP